MKSLKTQIGGSHYASMTIQPAEFILDNNIGKYEGDVIQYVSRWKEKNGLEDLKKAAQCCQILYDYYTARPEKLKAVIDKTKAQARTDSHSQAVNAARQAQEQAQKQKAKQDAKLIKAEG